jgi:Domain of unknown function (DUF1707)
VDTARRGYPPGDIRVSDADRDRALAELSEHFQAGRLTSEEFEERSGQALRAKTGTDLTTLLADLPQTQAPVTRPSVSPSGVSPHLPSHVPFVPIAVVAFAIAAAIAVLGSSGSGHPHRIIALAPVLVALIVIRGLARGGRRRGRL